MNGNTYDQTIILSTNNLTIRFPVGKTTIMPIKNASIDIKANSFNIIYGASGSGKSTLLNILGGLQQPTEGIVSVQNRDLYSMSADELAHFRANRIGFIHQRNNWVKSLTVLDNVALPLYAIGFSRAKASKIAMGSLERVGMQNFANYHPAFLSGGEQQRVAMARALVNEPLFVIADEPTGNLDTTNGDSLMKLLVNAQSEFRRTIILVTHNMEYIPFADHLLSLSDGHVTDIQQADTAKVTNELIKKTKQRIVELSKMKSEVVHA